MVSFSNPLGLLALASVAILILFYLFFKRPEKKIFPSVMFFFKHNKSNKKSSFFRFLRTNLLFFVQLLALLLLSLAIAGMALTSTQDSPTEHVVLVLDGSASMQATFEGGTRFSSAISDARNLIEGRGKVSIIFASNTPLILLDGGSTQQAIEILNSLEPTDTKGSLGEAMLQAMTLVDGGAVYVFSDFSSIGSVDPAIAKRQLNSQGSQVFFETYSEPVNNLGIIEVQTLGLQARVKIKNYHPDEVSFTVKGNSSSHSITLQGNAITDVTIPLVEGKNIIDLNIKDDFPVDNLAYIVVPKIQPINALYITNTNGPDYLRVALQSLGIVNVEVTRPPVIPEGEYDLYVIHEIEFDRLLPHALEDLWREVQAGKKIIIHAQSNSDRVNYQRLGIVNIQGRGGSTQLVDKVQNSITNDVTFGRVNSHFASTPKECSSWVETLEGSSVICINEFENGGSILWYGITNNNDFKLSSSYPLFWNNYLLDQFDVIQPDVNLETGTMYFLPTQKIETPGGEVETSRLMLYHSGFYSFGDVLLGANLLDQEESNVNRVHEFSDDSSVSGTRTSSSQRNKEIAKSLILLALLLVIIELALVKWRGDI